MKKKLYSLFLLIALSALCSNATNYNYWLVLKDSYFVFTDYSGGKYVYPNKSYFFEIKTNSGMQGSVSVGLQLLLPTGQRQRQRIFIQINKSI